MSRELGLASSTVATIWKNRGNIINAYGTESYDQDSNRESPKISELELLKSKCLSLTEGPVTCNSGTMVGCPIYKWCQGFQQISY